MPSFGNARSRTLPGVVYALSVAVFVLGTSEFGIAGLLPSIAADLSVSVPRAGLLISAYAIAMVVGAPLLTVLTLRWAPRATVPGAVAVFVAAQSLGALAPDYGTLLVARMLTAAAVGAFWAATAAVVVGAVEPSRRGRALSLQMAGLTVANVAGVPLGTVIGQQFGWRVTMWTIAAGAAVVAVALRWVLTAAGTAAGSAGVRSEFRVFTAGRVWLVLAVIAVFQTAMIACFGYLAPLVTELAGMPAGMVPVALALFGIGSLAGVQLGGRFADAHLWPTMFLGLVTAVLALLAFATGGSVPAVALVATFALGVAAFGGAAALNARMFGLAAGAPRLAGAVSASAFNVGATLGPWLGGLAIDTGWAYRGPAIVGVILSAVALGLAVLSRRLDQPATQPTADPVPATLHGSD